MKRSLLLPAVILTAAALGAALLITLLGGAAVDRGESGLHDSLFRLRYRVLGTAPVSSSLCVINVDDRDLEELGITLLNREVFGEALGVLAAGEARTVAVDIIFRNPVSPESDDLLIANTDGKTFFPVKSSGGKELLGSVPLMRGLTVGEGFEPRSVEGVIAPFPALARKAGGLGAISFYPDQDGITRRVPLLFAAEGGYLPSLVLTAAAHFLQTESIQIVTPETIRLKGALLPDGRRLDLEIPVDRRGHMAINFPAPLGKGMTGYSLGSLLALKGRMPKGLFKNTLVVVTENNSLNLNNAATPYNALAPHNEILISALNTILTGRFVQEPGKVDPLVCWLTLFLALGIMAVSRFSLKYFSVSVVAGYLIFLLVITIDFLMNNRLHSVIFSSLFLWFSFGGIWLYKRRSTRSFLNAASGVIEPGPAVEVERGEKGVKSPEWGENTILIVSENETVTTFLRSLLAEGNPVRIMDYKEFIPARLPIAWELMLLDFSAAPEEGFRILEALGQMKCFIPVIAFWSGASVSERQRILDRGAFDIFTGLFRRDEVAAKISAVLTMRNAQREAAREEVREKMARFLEIKEESPPVLTEISSRQQEVLRLLLLGKTGKEIAVELSLTESAVKKRTRNIYQKYNVNNKVELFNLLNTR